MAKTDVGSLDRNEPCVQISLPGTWWSALPENNTSPAGDMSMQLRRALKAADLVVRLRVDQRPLHQEQSVAGPLVSSAWDLYLVTRPRTHIERERCHDCLHCGRYEYL